MKALVLASGGVDSTTCLALAVKEWGAENVIALSLFYGQKHAKELQSARQVAEYYHTEHLQLDLSEIFRFGDNALLAESSQEIPRQSYAEQLSQKTGPVATYVPFRNGLFIAAAASIAQARECGLLYYGAHQDDAAGSAYPDCSEAFQQAMAEAIWQGSGQALKLTAPFIHNNKAEVVARGLELGVPYQLTWSCYEGNDLPCGQCGTCRDRLAAFRQNGAVDPLVYPANIQPKGATSHEQN